MEEFNKPDDDFRVHKCIMDPCLFRFTRGEDEALMLIHSDDCDLIGSSKAMMKDIMSRFNAKWGCKEVDSSFMLGVKRIITPVENGMKVELSMTAYIEGVYESFKEDMVGRKSHVSTPFPEDVFISRDKSKIPKEEARKFLDKGYQRLCGCLLWAARNVYPECQVGIRFLCRLMSHPSEKAWKAALHMKVPRRIVAIEIRQGTSQISRKSAFLPETRFAPLLAISSALELVMSEFESEHNQKS